MFELPELFGSPYVLPAIIVIVVLILLVLLLRMSRARRARAVKSGTSDRRAARKQGPAVTGAASAVTEAAGRRASEGLGRSASTAARTGGSTLLSSADPLAAVIADLLQGWGDITSEDTNRLKIFRAEKVIAAIAAAEVPKDLKNSEHARTRLNQLRHYASSLQTAQAAVAATPPAAEEETAGEERAAEASWGVEKSESHAGASDVVPGAKDTAPAPKLSWYGAPLPDDSADRAPEARAEKELERPAPSTDTLPEMSQPEPITVFSEEQPELVEETVAEIVEEELPVLDEAAEPDEAADADSFFSDFGAVVSTADQLLALPSDEQAGMLAFLSPGELGRVFQRTGDPALKKAVIDTLEHVGNTTALDVIHDCLDDPDPEIQVYALDAADRLLGVDQ